MNTQEQQPYINTREDGVFQFLGLPTNIRSSSETSRGAFGLLDHWSMPPGLATPYHTHRREDEAFYVMEGEIAFVCDGKWLRGKAGTYVFGPRGIPHGFKVIGNKPAGMLLLCAPAGFEQFVLELAKPASAPPAPPDMQKMAEAAARFEIDLHGPLPEEPAGFSDQDAGADGDLKDLNLRWIKAFNDRDWQTEQAMRSPEFRAYMSGAPEPLDYDAWTGFMLHFTTAFPDSHIEVESCVTEGEFVVSRWTLTGTHKAPFQGIPPTGHSVRFAGIEFNRVADGKLTEHWAQFDNVAMLRQLGVMPA